MIEDLKQVRDALERCVFNFELADKDGNFGLIQQSNEALATIDRIIADHIPDASKMVVPDGYALVPKKILESLHQKPVYGNYDYQCGYLDCLKDAKAMISVVPQPPTKGD